VDITLILL